MRLTILLFILGQVFKVASIFNKDFKHYIRNAKVRFLIKTADGKHARLFVFHMGKVTSFPGNHNDFDAALVWKDAATAFSVMTSKAPDASFNAAGEGKLEVEGMGFYAGWFEDGTKLIM